MLTAEESRLLLAKAIASAERRLRVARIPMSDALRLAGLDESTYYRWKEGNRYPRPRTWEKFSIAVDKLAPRRRLTKKATRK